ncbi:MAG: hypothetical protein HY731_13810 [Candidatus Tectomicrobia bacterium]|nr:hypothetical protein [Candidatus Tectomicrobia bacterium]
METITIKEEWLPIIERLGDVQHVTNTALKSYLVQQLTSTLEKLREEIKGFEQKYEGTFPKVKKKMEQNERFARSLDLIDKAWENDFLNWEILCQEYRQCEAELKTLLFD